MIEDIIHLIRDMIQLMRKSHLYIIELEIIALLVIDACTIPRCNGKCHFGHMFQSKAYLEKYFKKKCLPKCN